MISNAAIHSCEGREAAMYQNAPMNSEVVLENLKTDQPVHCQYPRGLGDFCFVGFWVTNALPGCSRAFEEILAVGQKYRVPPKIKALAWFSKNEDPENLIKPAVFTRSCRVDPPMTPRC